MPASKRLFLSPCVLATAAGAPDGESARLLFLAAAGKIRLASTGRILCEARNTILDLFGRPLWGWFVRAIGPLRLSLADSPTTAEKAVWPKPIPDQDAHILAGAIKARADILIALDRHHILKPSIRSSFPIPVMSPAEFLREFDQGKPATKGKSRE